MHLKIEVEVDMNCCSNLCKALRREEKSKVSRFIKAANLKKGRNIKSKDIIKIAKIGNTEKKTFISVEALQEKIVKEYEN